MRSTIVLVLLFSLPCLLAPSLATAQEPANKDKGQGYAFVGFGAVNADTGTLHFGGGVEANIYKGLGFGLEVGYLGPTQGLSEGIGLLSVDGQYTFLRGTPGKVRPFLTGGYTLAFRSGTMNAVNFGGGIHYWFSRRTGLRLEFRDHVSTSLWDAHAWQGRIGFDFR